MNANDRNTRLSHITTLWSLVQQAHAGAPDAVSAAQCKLMERYAGAVHRYLLGALRDADAADELFQEFSLRFLRGDFHRADPRRGRFRDFVKTALFHLIVDHRKGARAVPQPLGAAEPAAPAPTHSDAEREFLERWREELMDRTWSALEALEQRSGQPSYSVLRCRTAHPLLSSADMAECLGRELGRPFTVEGVRQALHRAREKFTDLLLREVVHSLEQPTAEELEQELSDLGLLAYCRAAMERRGYR